MPNSMGTGMGGRKKTLRAGLANLLDEDFTTAKAAPLGASRTAEPGPGTWNVTDSANSLSVTGGRLAVAAGTGTWGDPGLYTSEPLPRTPGMVVFTMGQVTTGTYRLGFNSVASSYPVVFDTLIGVDTFFGTTADNLQARVCRGENGFLTFSKIGSDWVLLTATEDSSTIAQFSSLFYGIINSNGVFNVDQVKAQWLGGTWDTEGLLNKTFLNQSTFAAGDTFTGQADGYLELKFTAETGVSKDFMFRRTDDNNCWIVRQNQSAGRVQLVEKVSGVETVRTYSSATLAAGTTYRIMVNLRAGKIRLQDATSATYSSATFNQTATGMKALHDGTEVRFWPTTGYDLTQSTTAFRTRRFLAYGDSKTAQGSSRKWHNYLTLTTGAIGVPATIARGGYTTAQMKALVDADLAAAVGTPEVVLYHLGVNDNAPDAAWLVNTAYIWDAMKAKWPNVQIYVARVWGRESFGYGGMTKANAIAAAQDTVIAAGRSAWVHISIDERILLENGDDGVTYTSDGVHPNDAGCRLVAAGYKAVLGW